MSVQVEKLEKNMAKLTIVVPAEELEKAAQAAYLKEKSKFPLQGFRKGKAPRAMIEKMYGKNIFCEQKGMEKYMTFTMFKKRQQIKNIMRIHSVQSTFQLEKMESCDVQTEKPSTCSIVNM